MPSPGLDNRLRQHSRRAGLMVGLSMALTIAVCIGSFVWIYAQVEPFTKDFVDAATVAPTTVSQTQPEDEEEPEATQPPEEEVEPTAVPEEEPEDDSNVTDPTDDEPEPTPTPTPEDEFTPTHFVSSEVPINFRPGPGVNTGDPVTTLAPGTELQYLGETEASQDAVTDGDTQWMQFETEDGLEGWVRQIDVTSNNAGQ